MTTDVRRCPVCGREVVRKRMGRPPRYCSRRCSWLRYEHAIRKPLRREAAAARAREAAREQRHERTRRRRARATAAARRRAERLRLLARPLDPVRAEAVQKAIRMARCKARRLWPRADVDDLAAAAWPLVTLAAWRWREGGGAPLGAWLYQRALGAMLDVVRQAAKRARRERAAGDMADAVA